MGISIDVIADTPLGENEDYDNGVLVEWARLHPSAIRTISVRDMVNKLLTRSQATTIDRLRVFGHGSPGAQWVGGGFHGTFPDFTRKPGQSIRFENGFLQDRELLMQLTGRFTASGSLAKPTALVELHGCSVGISSAGHGLARLLAELWGVRVRAGTDLQNADEEDRFEGGFIEANPLGTVWAHAFSNPPYILIAPLPSAPERSVFHIVGATVTKADWLSSLADKHYGDMLLWPIIFDKNKSATFTNPNVIRPAQRIEIPPLPALTSQQRDQVRARGRDWRS